jgi:adenine-specific DNA-methyltransferase
MNLLISVGCGMMVVSRQSSRHKMWTEITRPKCVELPSGEEIGISELSGREKVDYVREPHKILLDFPGARIFAPNPLTSGGFRKNQSLKYAFRGREFDPGIASGSCWKHTAVTDDGSPSGMDRLASASRLFIGRNQLRFKRYTDDFGFEEITNWWDGLGGASRPIYVVQTNIEILRHCTLMTTEPGDLVLDPTCGSGTTAYVAEQWGRRWIAIDTSRVPLALARQRLLTATFYYYKLKDEPRGPAGGFSFSRRQNRKGEEIGGIVPHITSSTIANDEPPEETIMVDRPDVVTNITRVAGPFCVEATIPTPVGWDEDNSQESDDDSGSFVGRMLEILRRSPVLQLGAGKTVTLRNVRPPAKSLSLSAEAVVENGLDKPVALVFGPENGAISETLVFEAAREAHGKSYTHLYVIGFAIQPNARRLIEDCESAIGIPATYVQATPDLMMGDLLKTMRSSQIFSVCGMPDVRLEKLPPESTGQPDRYHVSLLGLDSFDPTTMEPNHLKGDDVPAWLLDTDYNGLVFHGNQVFFPRTKAWEDLKKALNATHDPTVWEHLAGTVSAPFEAGEHQRVAVKVIDDRGNELIVVKPLAEAV